MDPGRLFGRGIAFPPRIIEGRLAWSAGEANVREAIRIILMTEQRERIRLPEFGGTLGKFLFEPNTVATRQRIQDQIAIALSTLGAADCGGVDRGRSRPRRRAAGGHRHGYLPARRNPGA